MAAVTDGAPGGPILVRMADTGFERIASFVGEHWLSLLLVLSAAVALGVVVLALVGGWVIGHRRTLWNRVRRVWGGAAHVAAGSEGPAENPTIHAQRPRVAWLARLTPRKFLVLHLVLGLALTLAATGFLRVAEEVGDQAGLVGFDTALSQALHRAVSPATVDFFHAFTWFGGGMALAILTVVVALLLLRRRQRTLALGWTVAMGGVGLLNSLLKTFYRRTRPTFEDPFAVLHSWSFPSGHSMSTFVAMGMLTYLALVFVRRKPLRIAAAALAAVWTVLIGFSRILLGAHYFSDVVAGFAAGTVWLAVCVSGLELVRRRERLSAAPAGSRADAASPAAPLPADPRGDAPLTHAPRSSA